jgi:subtilisin family serine protease
MKRTAHVCLVLLALVLAASTVNAQDPDDKIDPQLLLGLSGNPDSSAPLFVVMRDRADLGPASRIPERAARARAVVQALQAVANASQAGVRGHLQGQRVPFSSYWIHNSVFLPKGNLAQARALAQRPEVAAIAREPVLSIPAVQYSLTAAPQTIEWNLTNIRADLAWSVTRGAGTVVASIDTGVRHTHSALARQYRGYPENHLGNWYDPTGVCGARPCDNTDHGTHVMGTAVGDDGLGNRIGVAPEAKWMACKGCSDGATCLGSNLTACAQWIMDPFGNGTGHPDVVNNSWSAGPGNAWFMDLVDSWRAAGIFPAFAAGNSGPSCSTAGSPADYPGSFAGGAIDSLGSVAYFSARGPSSFFGIKPNVAAPGINVRSSIGTGDSSYTSFSGTSMASPHVAGTVALLWAAQPALRGKVALTERILQDTAARLVTAENCGGTGSQAPNNTYGYGRLDALAAVSTPAQLNEPPDVAISSPLPGTTYNCPATVRFAATASDLESGNLTNAIAWYDNGAGFGLGGSVSRSYACDAASVHNVTASVTDAARLTDSDTVAIQIRFCKPKAASCTYNGDCCSGKCGGKTGAKVCK